MTLSLRKRAEFLDLDCEKFNPQRRVARACCWSAPIPKIYVNTTIKILSRKHVVA